MNRSRIHAPIDKQEYDYSKSRDQSSGAWEHVPKVDKQGHRNQNVVQGRSASKTTRGLHQSRRLESKSPIRRSPRNHAPPRDFATPS